VEDTQPMKVHQALGHLCKLLLAGLGGYPHRSSSQLAHTNTNRLVSGFTWVYQVMFPSGIHGLIMQNGNSVSETAMMGSTFGWEMYMSPSILRRKVWDGAC
jgi:hypothetical protein